MALKHELACWAPYQPYQIRSVSHIGPRRLAACRNEQLPLPGSQALMMIDVATTAIAAAFAHASVMVPQHKLSRNLPATWTPAPSYMDFRARNEPTTHQRSTSNALAGGEEHPQGRANPSSDLLPC